MIFRLGFDLGDHTIEQLDREISRLIKRRDLLIADRLSHRKRETIGGVEYVSDATAPENELQFRDEDGRIVGKIVNLAGP